MGTLVGALGGHLSGILFDLQGCLSGSAVESLVTAAIRITAMSVAISPLFSTNHRVLQGAAQRGAQFHFIFVVLWAFFSCSKTSLFYLRNLHLPEGNPLKHPLLRGGFGCDFAGPLRFQIAAV